MPSAAHGLLDGIEERDKAFYAALQEEDDLGIVIRAQIHIEHELREFIRTVAPEPYAVNFAEMDFNETVQLALILGLNAEFKSALRAIGSLRNRFAHRIDMTLGDQEANNLYSSLGPQIEPLLRKTYSEAAKSSSFPEFDKLEYRDRLIMMLIFVRTGVVGENVIRKRKMASDQ